jgi:hypothetical protein
MKTITVFNVSKANRPVAVIAGEDAIQVRTSGVSLGSGDLFQVTAKDTLGFLNEEPVTEKYLALKILLDPTGNLQDRPH